MKGVSSAAAAVIIATISVALVGTTYFFTSGIMERAGAETFEIIDIFSNKLIIRNTGKQTITELRILVDGKEVGYEIEGDEIQAGKVGTVTIIPVDIEPGMHELAVISKSMSQTWRWQFEYVTTTTIPGVTTIVTTTSTTTTEPEEVTGQSIELSIKTEQGLAEIGKPVEWTSRINFNNPSPVDIENYLISFVIPEDASNIEIKDEEEKTVSKDSEMTVSVVSKETKNYILEYETPAPVAIEQKISKTRKKIIIKGSDDVHYKNILSFTEIPEILKLDEQAKIKLYQIKEQDGREIREEVRFTAYDTDENGFLDYIEWITPYLSEATYELVIEIIKAQHLDENRNFISDIYDEVYQLDNIWSETIPDGDYIRVVFELPLDNTRDITIYPRVITGTPRIEVYEIDGTEVIAEFTSITSNEYNKVFLTGLQGSQDTFDLLVLDGDIEIDHIVDPAPTFESYSEASSSGDVGSLDVPMPTGTVEGDLLLAVFTHDSSSGTLESPSDWTDLIPSTSTGASTLLISYKIATASEPSSYTFSSSDSDQLAVGIARFSGIDTNNPIDCQSSTNTGNSNAPQALACTTTISDTLVVRMMGADDDDYITPGNYPSGHTGAFTVRSTGTSFQTHCAMAYVIQTSIGSTGTADFSMTASEQWGTLTVALRPAYVNDPPTTPTNIQCNANDNCDIDADTEVTLQSSGSIDPDDPPDQITYYIEASLKEVMVTDDLESGIIQKIASSGEVTKFWDSFEDQVMWSYWTETGEGGWTIESAVTGIVVDGNVVAHSNNCDSECQLTSDTIDLSGETDVTLKFNWGINRLDIGEYLALDIYDGTWHEDVWGIFPTSNNYVGNGEVEIDLDASYNMVNNFQIRFVTMENSIWDYAEFDAVNIAVIGDDTETSTDWTEYYDVNSDYETVDEIKVEIEVYSYNPEASVQKLNNDPDLELEIFDGSGWVSIGTFNLPGTYTGDGYDETNHNFTLTTTNPPILSAWQASSNQDIRIRGINMDYYDATTIDEIKYINVWVTIDGKKWIEIGNHLEGDSFIWDTSILEDQNCVDLRARAIDLTGSNTYSDYYTKGSCLNIIHAVGWLDVTLLTPDPSVCIETYPCDWDQDSEQWINASVECKDGNCGEISALAMYNDSLTNTVEIPTSETDPFYIIYPITGDPDNDWYNVTPDSPYTPPARSKAAMAYDSKHDRTILYGGAFEATKGQQNDTWIFNYTDQKWYNVTSAMPIDERPPSRYKHAMAYDSNHDRTILFGGDDVKGVEQNDTWIFNYTDFKWYNVTPDGSPPPRFYPTMVYDSGNDAVVMFGGTPDGSSMFNDTWVLNYSDEIGWEWYNITPDKSPRAREEHYMSYDSDNKATILFGGYIYPDVEPQDYLNDTWVLNYSDEDGWKWYEIISDDSPVDSPSERYGHTMVYDSESKLTILFGGYGSYPGGYTNYNDTWVFNYTDQKWYNVTTTGPSVRRWHSMAYDSKHDRTILYGGYYSAQDANRSDTWILNYTFGGVGNPLSCDSLSSGDSCQLNWTVKVTGFPGEVYRLDVNFSSNLPNVDNNDTSDAYIRISYPPLRFEIKLPGKIPVSSSGTEPGNPTTPIEFNASSKTETVEPCVWDTFCSLRQTSLIPIFNFTNTGNVAEQWNISYTGTLPSGATLYGNTIYDYLTATQITPSGWIPNNNIQPGGYQEVWLWAEFVDAPPDFVEVTINHTSMPP